MAASANRRRACGPSLLLRAIARRATVSKSLLSGIGMANLLRSPRLNQTRATPNRPTSHASRDLVEGPAFVRVGRSIRYRLSDLRAHLVQVSPSCKEA